MLSFLRVQRKVPLLTVSPRNVVLPVCSKEGSSSYCVSGRNVVLPVCSKEGSSSYCVSEECCPSCVFKGRFLFLLCLWGMLSFLCVQRKVPLLTVSLRNVVLPVCSKEGSSSYCVSEECSTERWSSVSLRNVVLPVCSKEGSSSYCVSVYCSFDVKEHSTGKNVCLPCVSVSAWWWTSRWLWLTMTVLPFWQCSNLSFYICNISRIYRPHQSRQSVSDCWALVSGALVSGQIYRPHQSRHSVSNCWARFSGHGNSWPLLFLLLLLQPLLGRPLTSWRPTTGGDCRRRGSEVSCYRVFCCSCSFSSSCSWSYSCSSSSFSCSSYSSSSSSYCGMPVRRDRLAFLTGLYLDFSPYLSPPSSIPVWT